jgi:hypothetical protein
MRAKIEMKKDVLAVLSRKECNSYFVRVAVEYIPEEQDYLWDKWQNPEDYVVYYELPVDIYKYELILPPWFKHRRSNCIECYVVDEKGNYIARVDLPEGVYLREELQKREEKKLLLLKKIRKIFLKKIF